MICLLSQRESYEELLEGLLEGSDSCHCEEPRRTVRSHGGNERAARGNEELYMYIYIYIYIYIYT